MKAWKTIALAVLMCAAGAAGFLVGRSSVSKAGDARVVARVDTLRDTIPVPVAERYVETVRVPVVVSHSEAVDAPAEIITMVVDTVRDTITAEVPVTQKVYVDSTYKAWVSGFRPSLDSIEVYRKSTTVERTVTKERKLSFGITTGAGVGVFSRKPDVFVGLGLTWRVKL